MKSRFVLLGLAGAAVSLPASGAVHSFRAVGTVSSVGEMTSLLPLPVAPGDAFELAFSYDDTALDLIPFPDRGGYEIPFMRVTIAGSSLDWVGPGVGRGWIAIESNAEDPNMWGVSGCLGTCDPDNDEARLNFYFPPNTILSEALSDPPDATGATLVQFGLFSSTSGTPDEVQVDVALESVPEASAPRSLAAGILTLGAARLARRRRLLRAEPGPGAGAGAAAA